MDSESAINCIYLVGIFQCNNHGHFLPIPIETTIIHVTGQDRLRCEEEFLLSELGGIITAADVETKVGVS